MSRPKPDTVEELVEIEEALDKIADSLREMTPEQYWSDHTRKTLNFAKMSVETAARDLKEFVHGVDPFEK